MISIFNNRHTDTWPQAMSLMPLLESFPLAELHEWVKHHRPCLCLFKVAATEPDQTHYKLLIKSLLDKQTVSLPLFQSLSFNSV